MEKYHDRVITKPQSVLKRDLLDSHSALELTLKENSQSARELIEHQWLKFKGIFTETLNATNRIGAVEESYQLKEFYIKSKVMVQAKIDELSRSDTFDCGSEVSFMSSISASASVINRLDTNSASHNPETMTNFIGDLEKVELGLSNEKEEIRNVIDLTSGSFAQDIDSPSVSFAQTVAGQLTQTAGQGISTSATYIPNSVNPTFTGPPRTTTASIYTQAPPRTSGVSFSYANVDDWVSKTSDNIYAPKPNLAPNTEVQNLHLQHNVSTTSTAGRYNTPIFTGTNAGVPRNQVNTSSPWGCSTQDYYNTPLSSRRHVPPNQTQLDPLARHLIINELKRASSSPFTGEPHLYHDWIVSLRHRMEPLNISAYDKIDILFANTSGAPYEMIKTFKIAHRFDPDRAFNVIVSKLKERYGDEQQIARELKLKLQQFPVIKGNESDTSTASKLRELSDLCIIVKSRMEDIRDFNYYNLPSGIEEMRQAAAFH